MDQGWAVVIAAAIAVIGTVAGVVIGGRISATAAKEAAKVGADATREAAKITQQEAQADREVAQRVRFADDVRHLAAEILRDGQTHRDEVSLQVGNRLGTEPRSADHMPTIGSIEPMQRATQELRLTAHDPATAKTAHDFTTATWFLGAGLDYIAQRDRLPDGNVRLLTEAQFADFQRRMERWDQAEAVFVNAVRVELGADPFPEPDHD